MDPKMWQDMFTLALPVLEKIIRPIIVYIALIIGLRLAGKRELAQLNPFDLVVLLTLSNTVQNAIIGNDNSITGGLIGAATLLLINYLLAHLVYKHDKIEEIVEGSEDVLIEDGKIHYEALEHEVISIKELEIAAQRQGYNSLKDVERATLEPDGGISFISRKPEPDQTRHIELLARIDLLTTQVTALQGELQRQARRSSKQA